MSWWAAPATLIGIEKTGQLIQGLLVHPPLELDDRVKRYPVVVPAPGVKLREQKVATAGDGYVVDHSADTYLVAVDGKLAGKIAHATAPDQVAAIIRKHLYQP